MKNKLKLFFKSNWILLLSLSIFSYFILPVCFQNNDNINIVLAEHIDSGSILGSILQMNNTNLPNSFYNQNIPYHTGYYGYLYNSFAFWSFKVLRIFFKTYIDNNYFIYPLTAKLLNFSFAILTIILLYQLSKKILKYDISKIVFLSLFIVFPEYLHYVFHIKSDILGLLISIISLFFLYKYLQKPKITKNIILANIFGGLSVLCKQPHVFIIFPLFFGILISLKGRFRKKLISFFKIYLQSGVIFLFLFFIIHPYALLEPKTFIERQIAMTGMTAASHLDNFNFWMSVYTGSLLMFITAFAPIILITLNLFNKFRNKTTQYLTLVSTYILAFLIWLTFKVGPMRFIQYLIPVFPLSFLLFSYLFDISIKNSITAKNKKNKIFFIVIVIILLSVSIKTIKDTIPKTKNTIQSVYNFQKAETYLSTKEFENKFKNQELDKKTIIHSISLPIDNKLYKYTTNTWQVNEEIIENLKPDYLFIDFTVYWEKPYSYWKNIANQNHLDQEDLFINNDKEKNIILFYK